jgi:hypothetical protein
MFTVYLAALFALNSDGLYLIVNSSSHLKFLRFRVVWNTFRAPVKSKFCTYSVAEKR